MIALALAALLAQAMPAASDVPSSAPVGRMPVTFPPVPPGAAVIRNSGSTNAAGFTLTIAPDGAASVTQSSGFIQKVVAAPQTRWLFLKLREAAPLDALAVEHCMKSASFGSSTTIAWNDRTSGDLSCAGDPLGRELNRTIGVIVRELDISTLPRARRLRPL